MSLVTRRHSTFAGIPEYYCLAAKKCDYARLTSLTAGYRGGYRNNSGLTPTKLDRASVSGRAINFILTDFIIVGTYLSNTRRLPSVDFHVTKPFKASYIYIGAKQRV